MNLSLSYDISGSRALSDTAHKFQLTPDEQLVARMSDALADVDAMLRKLTQEKRRCSRSYHKKTAQTSRRHLKGLQIATLAFTHESEGNASYARYLRHTFPAIFTDGDAEVARSIETHFLSLEAGVLASWLDWDCPNMSASDIAAAKKLVDEANILKWVEHQNAEQGVAPSQRLVWEFRQSLHTYEVLASGSVVPHCASAAVKWMQRFRQRWQLQMGTQPVQETLPLEVLRAKVPSDEKSSDLFFWTPENKGETKRVRIVDPVLGPPIHL